MCLSKSTYKFVLLVPLFVKILTLEELPMENTIFKTESAIRNITNEIFLSLELKGIKNNPKLKQVRLIHDFFTKLSLKDQHTLAAISAISQPDQNSIINKTLRYIDILNEIQQEDLINHKQSSTVTNNINVINFVDQFLSSENRLNKSYFNDVLDMLQSDTEESNFTEYSKESLDDTKVLSDYEFWEPDLSGRRIFRGGSTKIKYFPFMASIQIFHSFQCGGSIIKSDLVITAASCLQLAHNNRFFRENPAFLSVTVGSNFYQGGGENIPVLEVYFHPGYDPKTLRDNLSIVRLVKKIKLCKKKKKAKIKKIDIDRQANKLPYNTPGVTIVGWGARTTSNILENPWLNRLSYSTLDIYSWNDCRDIYSRNFVTQKNFCAGYISKGSGACNKDAGDPGIVKGVLTGVVSFGTPRCGTPDAPTVFTKIGYYADWIDNIIDMNVPERKSRTTPRPPPLESSTRRIATSTTFKIQPIGGSHEKLTPIQDVGALRVLNEDPELKDLFDSILTDDDEKLIINDELNQLRQGTLRMESEEVTPELNQPVETKTNLKSTTNMALEPVMNVKQYTALDPNLIQDKSDGYFEDKLDEDVELDKNIVNIINNLDSDSVQNVHDDLSSADDLASRKGKHIESDIKTRTTRPTVPVEGPENNLNKNIEDSILTFLYLSDADKATKKFDKLIGSDDGEDGLSIPSSDFKDLTYRQFNKTKQFYEMLPKDEWYDLITEAIEEVSKNKQSKRLCFILFFL